MIALGHDVFGGHKPFFDRGGHTALEKNRPVGLPCPFEQTEILHIAGADLHHISIMLHHIKGLNVHHLGHHRQTDGLPDLG